MRVRFFVATIFVSSALLTACLDQPPSADCSARGPGVDLHGCDLSGVDFSWLDLTGANLSGADMTSAKFAGTNLTGANLTGAKLRNANMMDPRPDLEFHEMARADLTDASLVRADLSDASMGGSILDDANASFAKFRGAFMARMRMDGTNLTGADLREIYLWDTTGTGVNFSFSNLSGTNKDTQDVSFPDSTWFFTTCRDGSVQSEPCDFTSHLGE